MFGLAKRLSDKPQQGACRNQGIILAEPESAAAGGVQQHHRIFADVHSGHGIAQAGNCHSHCRLYVYFLKVEEHIHGGPDGSIVRDQDISPAFHKRVIDSTRNFIGGVQFVSSSASRSPFLLCVRNPAEAILRRDQAISKKWLLSVVFRTQLSAAQHLLALLHCVPEN